MSSGANDRVRIGVIGTGGRALQLMDHLIPKPRDPVQGGIPQWKTKSVDGADLVAVADVYEPHRNQAAARAGPKTAKFHDYRKLLDQKDVQAVIIAAPDHWHKQMLLDALAAGKDVYVEKPVTHALEEGPEEIQAVEKSGRIVQTGTQQRSWPHYVQGKANRRLGCPGRRAARGSLLVHELRRREARQNLPQKPGCLRPISTGRPGWDRRPPSRSIR